MMFPNRVYRVTDVSDVDELATKLTEYDWTTCTAFRLGDLLLVNDSTGADGAQEYAVVRNDRQIESLTVSWMDAARLKVLLDKLASDPEGEGENMGSVTIKTNHPAGSCSACA